MFYKIGHRGAAGHLPENTLPSFKKALELDANMIELDAHICKSNEIVVIHDKTINRVTSQKGLIKKKTYQELHTLNIPTLAAVFNLIDQKAKINIELKSANIAEPLANLIKDYVQNKNWTYENFLISSFDKKELKKIHQLLPQIKIGVLVTNKNPFTFFIKKIPFLLKPHLSFAKKIKSFSIHLHKSLINENIIQMAHRENLKIFAYTVNSQEEINYLKNIGIDGIFSNYPDRL